MPQGASSRAAIDAFVGIGSNLENPIRQVERALDELDGIARTRCIARSGLYRSPPMGPSDQPDYINAAAALRTRLSPHELLAALLRVEQAHGRSRDGRRWGPRTLDLDLLVYGEACIAEPGLTVPHPGIASRSFVVFPLLEIAPDLEVPGLATLRVLAQRTSNDGLTRLEAGA
jgi:2-amino-4-hydroxy-6-hydroxymethyldihydropteridine diphosphokinase